MIVEFLILLISALLSAYMYLTRNFNYWEKKGVYSIKPRLFFGNLYDAVTMKNSIGEHLANMYSNSPDQPYVGFYSFDKPSVLFRDLDLIKNVLIKDFSFFTDRVFAPNMDKDPLAARGLFALKNPGWWLHRSKLNPSFSGFRIKKMGTIVNECCEMSIAHLKTLAENDASIEMKTEMVKLTTNSIASCAFGLDAKALTEDSEIVNINKDAFLISRLTALKNLLLFFAPEVVKTLALKYASKSSYDMIRKIIWETVKAREESGLIRHDYIDLAMEIRKNGGLDDDADKKFILDGDDFVAHCYVFMIAGFETSSTTLSLTMYELAKNQELQTRLRDDITETLEKHNGQITYDSVSDMKYLDMVFLETIRKYPPLPFLDRRCNQNYKIPGTDVVIEKGTNVYIPIMGLQHDPTYFEDPERYDPDRFTPENLRNIPKMAYIPFGEGKRICVGLRFGQLQVKMGLAHVITNFSIELASGMERELPIESKSFTFLLRGGIFLKLKPLK